jgi:hypothetical protein
MTNLELSAAAGAAGSAAALWRLLAAMETGSASLDRLGMRGCLALYSLLRFGPQLLLNPAIPRALMCIANNESGGRPSMNLGDKEASGGPSIGLMQVYRTTAVDLGLWTPPPGASVDAAKKAYAALATDEALGIRWGVAVFANKLKIAQGNIPEAIRRYNGSGPSAEAYKQRALDFAAVRKWSLT